MSKEDLKYPEFIKNKRQKLGLTQKEFAEILGLKESGERTISGWERGEHKPSSTKRKQIDDLSTKVPFKEKDTWFNYIDLFAGIGGIRLPFQQLGGKCVFSSEWDKFAKKTYAVNFGELPHGDITKIELKEIPDHDVLLAGFPCQAFSQAGLRKGFMDTRGTMFFEIQRILSQKRPKMFLLENVKQLKGHDQGNTLSTIMSILRGDFISKIPSGVPISEGIRKSLESRLDYAADYRILSAKNFGVPQNRQRLYILGFDRACFNGVDLDFELDRIFSKLEARRSKPSLGKILEDNKTVDKKFTISDRLLAGHERRRREHKKKGNGFGYCLFNQDSPYCNTISARYYKDGSEILIDQSDIRQNPRKLTPRECARIQGFPERFIVDAVSSLQIYKQFGNSVSVPVIKAIAKLGLEVLKENR